MTSKSTILVTEHAEFYRATKGAEVRHYPTNAQNARADAHAFDEDGITVIVSGFGVYDTTISTSYAVALHATKAAAEAHEPSPVPPKPTGLFNKPGVNAAHVGSGKRSRS